MKMMSPALRGLLALAAILVCSTVLGSVAEAGQGWLYANKHYNPSDLKAMGAAVSTEVYVYGLDGALISSGLGAGAFPVGKKIALDAGEYLVEVGRARTRHNLRRVKVTEGAVTLIKTGWVGITTWDRGEQPVDECMPWSAELRAYVVVDGKRHLVMSNESARRGPKGRIQLAVGTYEIHWHGLAVTVEVQADKVIHLATGGMGPFLGADVRMFAEKSDAAGVPSVKMCADGPTHMLAGKWWLSQTEKIEEYPYEKRVWQQMEVPAMDDQNVKGLRPDQIQGRVLRGVALTALTAEETKALAAYKEGALKRSAPSKGSKFQMDDNPF